MLRKLILGAGVFAALLAVLIFSGKIPLGNPDQTAAGEVVLWGTLPEPEMNKVVQEFNPKAKTYRVVYKEIREDKFNQTLLEALANGAGPDMILAPYQMILTQSPRLYPFPLASLGEKAFKDTYVDGSNVMWTPLGALALPVSVDPMVLFYNRSLFSKHGIANPPTYWDEVVNVVPTLTSANAQGQFLESGIALGAPNLAYAKDIIMAIIWQLGQVPVLAFYDQAGAISLQIAANTPTTEGGDVFPLSTVIRFFTQFADPTQRTYTWNQFSGNADDQFVAEKVAMYVGYASELGTLRARNPKADIEMTYLPQTRGYGTFATGMKMYGIATLKSSKNPVTALSVEAQFAGGGVSPTIAGIVGSVPALRSYASVPGVDAVISLSMLNARGWYDSFSDASTAYVMSMLSDVISGRAGVTDAANTFVARLRDLYTPQ
ncbi:MAG: ABC transporter substrate-binding protein [Candidatus Paceibacterota bacterium]